LDGLGSPILFSSSNHLVCAIIYNTTIFSWDDKDWHQVLTLDISQWQRQPPESFDEGFIFRSSSRSDQTDLWVVKKDLSAPELWLQDKPKPQPGVYNNGMNKPDNSSLHPLGKSPEGEQLTSSVATFSNSNLYLLVDHTIATYISNRWTATEKDGYNAKLVCLSHDGLGPFVIPLKFDLELMHHVSPSGTQHTVLPQSTWMYFAGDNLYIGQSETLGIWAIPVAEIEAAIAAQKQVMLAKKHQDAEAVRQLRDKMLAQYDRNHNGIIDPDEKEEALDDPAFIESELDVMDANHNGRLDPEEIVYFDANTNKILEAKEQAGFDIAQHLLAVKLLKKFDANGDGLLDRREFDDLLQPIFAVNTLSSSSLSFPDQNRDGQVGLGELELFLNQQTRGGLRVRRSPLAISKQIGADPNKPIDSKQIFKTTVEAYWQNPGSITNRPPFNRMPPGRVVVTNGTQSGKAQ
jgi:hypothetical protein